jgi:cytidylate kinase
VRARRRFFERSAADQSADLGTIARRIEARDRQDETRPIDPLRKADDAVLIDTSDMPLGSVLELMTKVVAECRSPG